MGINTMVFSWKRSQPGRELLSARHFDDMVSYLSGLQRDGLIESFETVILHPNGLMNGFILIKGEDAKLGQVLDSQAWIENITRSQMHLDDPVLSYGVCGQQAKELLALWVSAIPK